MYLGSLIRWLTAGKDCSTYCRYMWSSSYHKSFLVPSLWHKYKNKKKDVCLGVKRTLSTCSCLWKCKWDLPACINKCPCVWEQVNRNFKTCPGQLAALESQHWVGKQERMIGIRLFTVNTNQHCLVIMQECTLLSSLCFFLCVFDLL